MDDREHAFRHGQESDRGPAERRSNAGNRSDAPSRAGRGRRHDGQGKGVIRHGAQERGRRKARGPDRGKSPRRNGWRHGCRGRTRKARAYPEDGARKAGSARPHVRQALFLCGSRRPARRHHRRPLLVHGARRDARPHHPRGETSQYRGPRHAHGPGFRTSCGQHARGRSQ